MRCERADLPGAPAWWTCLADLPGPAWWICLADLPGRQKRCHPLEAPQHRGIPPPRKDVYMLDIHIHLQPDDDAELRLHIMDVSSEQDMGSSTDLLAQTLADRFRCVL